MTLRSQFAATQLAEQLQSKSVVLARQALAVHVAAPEGNEMLTALSIFRHWKWKFQ